MSQPPRPTSAPGRRKASPPSLGGQLHTPPMESIPAPPFGAGGGAFVAGSNENPLQPPRPGVNVWPSSMDDPEIENNSSSGGSGASRQPSFDQQAMMAASIDSLASWGALQGGSSVMCFDDQSGFQQPQSDFDDPPEFTIPTSVVAANGQRGSTGSGNNNNIGVVEDFVFAPPQPHFHGPPNLPRATHPQSQPQYNAGGGGGFVAHSVLIDSMQEQLLLRSNSMGSNGGLNSPVQVLSPSGSFSQQVAAAGGGGAPSPIPAPAYFKNASSSSSGGDNPAATLLESSPSLTAEESASMLFNPVAAVLQSAASGPRTGRRLRDILQDVKLKDVTLETIREALAATGNQTTNVRGAMWGKLDAAEAAAALPRSVSVDAPDQRWAQFCANLVSTIRGKAEAAVAAALAASATPSRRINPSNLGYSPASFQAFSSAAAAASASAASPARSPSTGSDGATAELNAAIFVLTEATKFLRSEGRLQKLVRTDGDAARTVILEAKEEAKAARDALAMANGQVADLHDEIRRLHAELGAKSRRVEELEDVRHNLQLGIARAASKVLGASNNNNSNNSDGSGSRGSGAASTTAISAKESNPEYYLSFLEGIAAEAAQLRLEMDAALFIGTQQTEWAIKEGQEAERIVQRLAAAKEQLNDCSTHMMAMRTHIAKLEQQLEPLRGREFQLQQSEHALRYHDTALWSTFAFNGLTGAHADALQFAVRAFLRSAAQCQGKVSVSPVPEADYSILDTAMQRHNASTGASSASSSALTTSSSAAAMQAALTATSAAKDAFALVPQQLLGGGVTMLSLLDGIAQAHRKMGSGTGLAIEAQAVLGQAREILARFASWPEGRVHPASASATALFDGLLRSVMTGSGASFPNYAPPPPSAPAKARQRVAAEYSCALLAAMQREALQGHSECFLIYSVATGQAPLGALRALPRLADRLFVRLQSNVSTRGGGGGAGAGSGGDGSGAASGVFGIGMILSAAANSGNPPGSPGAGSAAMAASGGGGGAAPKPARAGGGKAGGSSTVPRDVFLRTVRDMFPRAAEASILALGLVTFAAQDRPSPDLIYTPFFRDKDHAGPGMVLSAIYRVALDEQRRVLEELQMAVSQAAWKRFLAQKDAEDEIESEEERTSSAGSSQPGTSRSGATATTAAADPQQQQQRPLPAVNSGRSGAPPRPGSAGAAPAAAVNSPRSASASSRPGGKTSGRGGGGAAANAAGAGGGAAQNANVTDVPTSDRALVSLRDIGLAVFAVNPHCSHREMAKVIAVAAADPTIETSYMTRMKTVASASIMAASSGLGKQPIEMPVLNKMVKVDEAFRRIRSTLFLELYDKMSVEASDD